MNSSAFSATNLQAFVVGGNHNFAVSKEQLFSWGGNSNGELGLGDTRSRFEPSTVPVSPGTQIQLAASSSGHTCFVAKIAETEGVKCWGDNRFGQLGLGIEASAIGGAPDQTLEKLPWVQLGNNKKVRQLALIPSHSCALFIDETVKCWGRNAAGELGIGSSAAFVGKTAAQMGENLPTVSLGAQKLESIVAGNGFTCALLTDRSVKCWGSAISIGSGQAKDIGKNANEMGDALKPVDLGGAKVQKIVAGGLYVCVLLDTGEIKCWGRNGSGILGSAKALDVVIGEKPEEMGKALSPVLLEPGLRAVNLGCGYAHCCVVLENQALQCWGDNSVGQLGVGDTKSRGDNAVLMGANLPYVDLGTFSAPMQLLMGSVHSCVMFDEGTAKCWGANTFGQCGANRKVSGFGTKPSDMGEALPYITF